MNKILSVLRKVTFFVQTISNAFLALLAALRAADSVMTKNSSGLSAAA